MKQWLLMLATWSLLIVIWAAFVPADQPNSSGHVVTGHVRDRT